MVVTPRRVAVTATIAASMAVLIYLMATQNALGSLLITLGLPIVVLCGVVRRVISGNRTSAAVRPAVQGMGEVQDVVLNRPGLAVTYGSPVQAVVMEYDPTSHDPITDESGRHGGLPSTDRS
jgi:hypothetical protein